MLWNWVLWKQDTTWLPFETHEVIIWIIPLQRHVRMHFLYRCMIQWLTWPLGKFDLLVRCLETQQTLKEGLLYSYYRWKGMVHAGRGRQILFCPGVSQIFINRDGICSGKSHFPFHIPSGWHTMTALELMPLGWSCIADHHSKHPEETKRRPFCPQSTNGRGEIAHLKQI